MCENQPAPDTPEAQRLPPQQNKLLKTAGWLAVFVSGLAVGVLLFGLISRTPDSPLDFPVIEEKLRVLQQTIEEYFLFPADPVSLENGIYSGLLQSLDDPYSVYLTPDELAALESEYAANYCGIGAEVQQDAVGQIDVTVVYDGSPAQQAGLRPGDVILEVDGTSAKGLALTTIVTGHIMGEPGTEVSFRVYRPENGQTLLLTAVRAPIEVKTVEGRMLKDATGYIRVLDFYDTTADEFIEQCGRLEGQGMRRLILDLRDNPGGSLDAVVRMLDYILPDGDLRFSRALGKSTIVFTQSKHGDEATYLAGDGHALAVPIKVLMNRDSASASEILAGCLRDYGLAELVGETSFGKGIVQSLFKLDGGDAVKLTVAQYFTPSGFSLHGVGLPPDVELPDPTPSGEVGPTDPASDPWVLATLALFDRNPELEPLCPGADTAIAPPQSLLEALPDGFICREKHLAITEQAMDRLAAAFSQSSGRRIEQREDIWFFKRGEQEQPPFSHAISYWFRSEAQDEAAYLSFNFDLDGERLHSVECDMLDPGQSVELAAQILDCAGDPLSETGRAAVLDAMEQGKPYRLNGKRSRLEVLEYDGSAYLLITAS